MVRHFTEHMIKYKDTAVALEHNLKFVSKYISFSCEEWDQFFLSSTKCVLHAAENYKNVRNPERETKVPTSALNVFSSV